MGAFRRFDHHLRSLPESFTSHVQELWSQGRCPQHRVAMASYAAAATLAFQDSFKAGSDGFVSSVAAHLASNLGEKATGSRTPTVEELQHSFHHTLPDLIAAAFEPEPAHGLFGSLLGKFFGRLYRLRADEELLSIQNALEAKLGEVPMDEGRVVQKNLRTLAEALRFIDLGDFRSALNTLESRLAGPCRSRAEGWIRSAREALLLRQASEAFQARTRCLSMSLVE